MNGVIYNGEEMIEGADVFMKRLIDKEKLFAFMTNNSKPTSHEQLLNTGQVGHKCG